MKFLGMEKITLEIKKKRLAANEFMHMKKNLKITLKETDTKIIDSNIEEKVYWTCFYLCHISVAFSKPY